MSGVGGEADEISANADISWLARSGIYDGLFVHCRTQCLQSPYAIGVLCRINLATNKFASSIKRCYRCISQSNAGVINTLSRFRMIEDAFQKRTCIGHGWYREK